MTNELLGTTVGKLRNKLHRLMKQRYAAEAEVKLTVEEFILLNMIEAQTDQILQNIAIATGKNKSVVMRMIDSLEEKGLAKRTVNPEDRRENLLSITDKGAEVVTQYQAIEKRLSNDLLEGIPADEVATFFRVVDLITQRANRL
ncbi:MULTISPECIES: MarR family winged helix-turn-helix transcriptional regulator [unclassified Barnesiella]|uniref:MarR family winged helix-turn-helix transcriptional regulator n=1 Tax=unclassified Barnesiella TaxID=2645177 RepID=UPI001F8E7F84|nr:MarR family winged helix-turn-helix transcriptional regulator [Barnesiella sp. ET7]MCR8911195.1 MarR family winged helix-turn-helix transcriptional regulator [Barnesiella sp. ET7]HJB73651.1 MarR family winged helix-turn-helix transcriptional regulator [Candidatus Barnesiella merdigallinarum]